MIRPSITRALALTLSLTLVICCILPAFPALAQSTMLYNVFDGESGAIISVPVDGTSGTLREPHKLYADPEVFRMTTMRLTADDSTLFFMNELDDAQLVGITDLKDPAATTKLQLNDRPVQIQVHNNYGVASGNNGWLYLVSLTKQRILKSTQPGKSMTPAAKRIVDFNLTDDGRHIVAVFNYDSAGNGTLGNRVAILETATLDVVADLPLPRDHENLHVADSKIDGPGPKWVILSPESNSLILGLELYGAVTIMDLDAALNGKIENPTTLSTAPDGSWGTSFPERGMVFQQQDRYYLWVTNASDAGDCTIIDLGSRTVATSIKTGTRSLTSPVLMPDGNTLVAASEGFIRSVNGDKIERQHQDGKVVFVIDVTDPHSTDIPVKTYTLPDYIYEVAQIPDSSNLVLLSRRHEDNTLSLATFDITTGKVIDECPSLGVTRTFLSLPASR